MKSKDKYIEEIKKIIEKEQITPNDFLSILELASTIELLMFKKSLKRLIDQWKKNKNVVRKSSFYNYKTFTVSPASK